MMREFFVVFVMPFLHSTAAVDVLCAARSLMAGLDSAGQRGRFLCLAAFCDNTGALLDARVIADSDFFRAIATVERSSAPSIVDSMGLR